MTKTPEQDKGCVASQLAEEWANKEGDLWFADISTYTDGHKSAVKQAYFAGYQAAQQWISVKERLPEVPEEMPYYGASTCVLITVVGESDQETPIKPYVTVAHLMQFKSEEPSWIACACSVIGYCDELGEWKLEQVSHWMALPKPPEDK